MFPDDIDLNNLFQNRIWGYFKTKAFHVRDVNCVSPVIVSEIDQQDIMSFF